MLRLFLSLTLLQAQTNWPHYGNDAGAMRWSELRQIHTGNVARLQTAWTHRMGKAGSEAIPIVVDGILYATAPDGVYALVPETGELLWKYEGSPMALRGLAYWPGGKNRPPRIFVGNGQYLLALDATTGKPAPAFGNEGRVDLKPGVLDGLPTGKYLLQSPPAIFGDIVITGSSNGEGAPTLGAYGDVRGWDAHTGKLLWTFHTVPRPGEPGAETWAPGAWKNRSGTNVWGFLTVDVSRGIVYLPLGSPTTDFYGADRHGDNLYGNSLVALDARTGKKLWHQQLVHHDLWDYDPAAPPALFDIKREGKTIPAVAQITKTGLLFVFHRVTGAPIYGLEERPVPQTTLPGEKTSPTQPFPVKPPPLSRLSMTKEELYSESPEHAQFCRDLFTKNNLRLAPPYTPLGTERFDLFFPSTLGGGNWGGVSVDPTAQKLFVNIMNIGQWGRMEKKGDTYVRTSPFGPYARFWDPKTRIPCNKPPFGEMLAIDLASGDIAWRSPLGRIEALEAAGVKDTGSVNLGGSIATAGQLLFIGAANDSRFRAYDSRNGKLLWETKLEASAHTAPVTYQGRDGRQYVAVMAAGGGGFLGGGSSNTLVAFALPDVPRKALPVEVSKAVARAKELRKNAPRVGIHPPLVLDTNETAALVNRSCGQGCHTLEVVTSQRHSAGEWRNLVTNMIARGAPVKEKEAEVIIQYLSSTLRP
ncbi:MAG: pyrroloquinoline quinone-dependent dehydrogenase [Bryobacter sp.]|nr:pyrroloquinoline quinone-dependent dehydrogenase [Bryobacter sp.]